MENRAFKDMSEEEILEILNQIHRENQEQEKRLLDKIEKYKNRNLEEDHDETFWDINRKRNDT